MTRKLTRISWWQWKHYEHCRIMLWPSFSGAINTHLVLGVVCGGVVLYVHRGIILPGLVLSDRSWPGNIMGGGIYVVRLIYLTKLQKHLSELIPNSCLHCSQRLFFFLLLDLLLLRVLWVQTNPYQALIFQIICSKLPKVFVQNATYISCSVWQIMTRRDNGGW